MSSRRCIAEAIENRGPFLDIGCANGYLVEWAPHPIEPYSLDVSPKLVALARERLPVSATHSGHAANGRKVAVVTL